MSVALVPMSIGSKRVSREGCSKGSQTGKTATDFP